MSERSNVVRTRMLSISSALGAVLDTGKGTQTFKDFKLAHGVAPVSQSNLTRSLITMAETHVNGSDLEPISRKEVKEIIDKASGVGLTLKPTLKYDDWRSLGRFLAYIQNGQMWWLGDWLAYGEKKYGEKYADAMSITGYSYKTCANAKYVAGAIEISRRRESVPFAQHAVIAPLPPDEQERWLKQIEDKHYSVIQLRTEVQKMRALADKTIETTSRNVTGQEEPTTAATQGTEAAPDAKEVEPIEAAKPVLPNAIEAASRRRRVQIHKMLKQAVADANAFVSVVSQEFANPGKHADVVKVEIDKLDGLLRQIKALLVE